MPPSGARQPWPADPPARTLAVIAAALFLVNLMLLPGIAFLILLALWLRHRRRAGALACVHLAQAVRASVVGGVLLFVTALIVVLNGVHSAWTWVAAILYFTCVHSTLILLGVLALANALNGRPWRYPLIGGRGDERTA